MKLAVLDVGNTITVIGTYVDDIAGDSWRITTESRTADEYQLLLGQMIGTNIRLDGAVLGSVVPSVTQALRPALERMCDGPVLIVGPGVKSGLAINVDDAREVGADRIANAIGAIDRHGAPVLCVDFGTATTVDLVGENADYLGGVITPGIAVSSEALVASTSALRRVEIAAPDQIVGRNTAHAIQSGLVYGTTAMIDGLVTSIMSEYRLSADTPVVATGGFAELIALHSRVITHVEEDLTLWGLRLVFLRTFGSR